MDCAPGIDLETRDFFGCTPLMLAAYYGSKETLKLLCEMGMYNHLIQCKCIAEEKCGHGCIIAK